MLKKINIFIIAGFAIITCIASILIIKRLKKPTVKSPIDYTV